MHKLEIEQPFARLSIEESMDEALLDLWVSSEDDMDSEVVNILLSEPEAQKLNAFLSAWLSLRGIYKNRKDQDE